VVTAIARINKCFIFFILKRVLAIKN